MQNIADSGQELEMAQGPDDLVENEADEETTETGQNWDSDENWNSWGSYTSDDSENETANSGSEWDKPECYEEHVSNGFGKAMPYPVPEWQKKTDGTAEQLAEPNMDAFPPPDYFSAALKHPFLYWLVELVGASFFDFSQRELRDQLNSRHRNEQHFLHEFYRSTMLKLNWNNTDTIELKYWPLMVEQARLSSEAYCYPLPGNPALTPRDTILGRADKLRNAVFDRHEIWMCALRNIMRIPAVLKDDTRTARVEMVWRVVNEDSDVEEQTICKVYKMLGLTQTPCTTFLQVHSRVLALLEDGCFLFGKRKDPGIFEHMGWYAAQGVELRMWKNEWVFNAPPLWNPESPVNHFILGVKQITQLELLRAVFDHTVDLRNSVAHRNILNQGTLCWYAQLAILLLILFDERKLAIEIEALVEGFLSKKSRNKVLSRLSEYYDGRDVPADQLGECKRRDAVLEIHGQMEPHQRSEEALREPPEAAMSDICTAEASTSSVETPGFLTFEGAMSYTSPPPLGPTTVASPNPEEILSSTGPSTSAPAKTLSNKEICELAIEKYVYSNSMHEPLRLDPTAPETQSEESTVEIPQESTAEQDESETFCCQWCRVSGRLCC